MEDQSSKLREQKKEKPERVWLPPASITIFVVPGSIIPMETAGVLNLEAEIPLYCSSHIVVITLKL